METTLIWSIGVLHHVRPFYPDLTAVAFFIFYIKTRVYLFERTRTVLFFILITVAPIWAIIMDGGFSVWSEFVFKLILNLFIPSSLCKELQIQCSFWSRHHCSFFWFCKWLIMEISQVRCLHTFVLHFLVNT